jgi:hypothetical protein
MGKSKEQKQAAKAAKQEAKALKIQQREQNQQDRYAAAAADGKIRASELQDIFGKNVGRLGGPSREQMATELAKFALGNPNVQIGKGVTQQTGLKMRTDESGGRFATYTPEMVTPLRNPNSSVSSPYRATADFGKANTSWSATAGGMYRFGGSPSAPMAPASTGSDYEYTPPSFDTYNPTPLVDGYGGSGSGGTAPDSAPSPSPQFMPGGVGSSVDGGATGFRRKKSSARAAGLTTKGSGRLRINQGSTGSTGLNIGL